MGEDVDMLVIVELRHSKFNSFLSKWHFVAYFFAGIAKVTQRHVNLYYFDSLFIF